jgi:nitroreductase
MNETINVINERVSLRRYSPEKISQEHIDVIINSAMRAPTARNMMLYSIIQVDDQSKKDSLGETCNHPFIAKAPLILLFLADMQRWYDFYKTFDVPKYCNEKKMDFLTPKASNLMMSCCDALIAAQNTVIAAESLGIGSCYIGDIMCQCEAHREMFRLPKWTFPITLVCYGYYPQDMKRNLATRFDNKFIHFKEIYKHLSHEEFEEMLVDLEKKRSKAMNTNNLNLAQDTFMNFTLGEPELEELRSVKVLLNDWVT